VFHAGIVAIATMAMGAPGAVSVIAQTGAGPEIAGACTFTIAPTSKSSPVGGEATTVSVTTGSTCVWTAASGAPWILVSSGSSGTGNGTVGLTIGPNTTTSQRTGTVTVADQTVTVTQAAGSCTYTVMPSSLTVNARGLSSSFSVSTGAGCTWNATGMPSWITISETTQTGPGLLAYTIAPFADTITRSVTLTIAGQAVVVTQNAAGAPPAPSNVRVVGGAQ
jgi:hypothetical protein